MSVSQCVVFWSAPAVSVSFFLQPIKRIYGGYKNQCMQNFFLCLGTDYFPVQANLNHSTLTACLMSNMQYNWCLNPKLTFRMFSEQIMRISSVCQRLVQYNSKIKINKNNQIQAQEECHATLATKERWLCSEKSNRQIMFMCYIGLVSMWSGSFMST